MSYFSMHNHSSYSNIKLLDSINRLEDMVEYAHEIGLSGICISEHAVISSHIQFLKAYEKLKKTGKMRPDFKVGLGVEAYLCVEPTLEEVKQKAANRETKFYHFLLIALNKKGHEQLRELTTQAWENSFMLYGQQRTPNLMSEVENIIQKGDVVASTACLGGVVPTLLLKIYNANTEEEKEKYKKELEWFTDWCIKVFGRDNFYLELQPSDNEEQKIANQLLISYAKYKGLKNTVATDAHYLKKEDREIHKICLQSQNGEREVDLFYDSTYIMSEKEVREYMEDYINKEDIDNAFAATMEVHEKMETYELKRPTAVPMPDIPEYTLKDTLMPYYGTHKYIKTFAESPHDIDRYYLHLVQEGLEQQVFTREGINEEVKKQYVDRIEDELKEIWLISEKMDQRVSAYYVLTKDIVDVLWDEGDSIVGCGRGCFKPDSKVLMYNGQNKEIKDVQIGDAVVSHTGNKRKVLDKMIYPIKEEVVKIKTSSNDEVVCTKDHEILSVVTHPCENETYKTIHCTTLCKRKEKCSFANLEKLKWNKAGDLKRGDFVVYPIPKLKEKDIPLIDLSLFVSDTGYMKVKEREIEVYSGKECGRLRHTYNRYIDCNDYDMMWLMGAFIGNGWVKSDGESIGIAFHSAHTKKIEKCKRLLKKISGKEPSIRLHETKQVVQLIIYSRLLNKLFKMLFGSGAVNKKIPDIFMEAPKEYKKGLIKGLFETDGHVSTKENKVNYSSINYNLVSQLKLLLASFGYLGQIGRRIHKEENWSDELKLNFSGAQAVQLKEEILDVFEHIPMKWSRNTFYKDENYLYFQVNKVETEHYEGDVYDLTIEEDSSYIINQNVVHNSAGGFLTVYLLGITQVDGLKEGFPAHRHLHHLRPEMPDIDLDTENAKRERILQALKNKYGEDKVINIATFSTSGSRNSLLMAARGMGLDSDEVSYLTSLLPNERGFVMDLKTAFFGDENKNKKPITELVNAVNKYKGLMDAALKLEGLVTNVSSHASGVYIYNERYTKQNAMMKTNAGHKITAWNMTDSDQMGGLKVDLLTILTLDRVRIALDFLVELGLVEDKGSLKANYNSYLHPDTLERDDIKMWEKVGNNEVVDLFQFDTPVGLQCAKKSKPTSIEEVTSINSLMRLVSEKEEQPIDKYVRFKNNIEEWYQEMRDYGLSEDEIELMKSEIGSSYGVASSQEEMMQMLQNPKIANFTIEEANYARKVIAKKKMDEIPKLKELYYRKGLSDD